MTKPKPNKTNHCKRCRYNWIGRTPFPAVCPNCHSVYWRTKKKVSKYGRPYGVKNKKKIDKQLVVDSQSSQNNSNNAQEIN